MMTDEELPEPNFDDFNYAAYTYSHDLDFLSKLAQRGVSPSYILEGFLYHTYAFLDCLDFSDNAELSNDVMQKYSDFKRYFGETILAGKRSSFERAMSIGQFVEILISNGMPRIAAIGATSKWLDMGNSTVRTHNENYRKAYNDTPYFGFRLRHLIIQMSDKVLNDDSFPLEHVRSKAAFKKTRAHYEERINAWNDMFVKLEEMGTQK